MKQHKHYDAFNQILITYPSTKIKMCIFKIYSIHKPCHKFYKMGQTKQLILQIHQFLNPLKPKSPYQIHLNLYTYKNPI